MNYQFYFCVAAMMLMCAYTAWTNSRPPRH